jgi:hypothetical protein
MRVRLWSGDLLEARTGFAIEGRSLDGHWCARAFLGVDPEQHLGITRLEVWPDTPGAQPQGSLDGRVLRGLPLGRWLAEAHSRLADEETLAATGSGYDPMLEEMGYSGASQDRKEWARRVAEEARSVTLRRGRRGYPDDHYRRIALAYLDLQRQGVTQGIQQRLAEQEQRQWQTIRDWVHIATKKGFLTPGSRGRAGRMPGPNLYNA